VSIPADEPLALDSLEPRLANRAVYASGVQTRRALLDEASTLFRARGLAGVSKAEIATAAGAHPSQVTYYFGTKESLFVEAACRDVLHLAADVEAAAARTRTPRTYVAALVRAALDSPALLFFTEAVLVARHDEFLAPRAQQTFERLHREGERAVAVNLVRRGWRIRADAAAEARGFWAAVLGVALEQATLGAKKKTTTAEATIQLVLNLYEPCAHDREGQPR
jgi:AcrR family transcriptional regulator